MSHLNKLLITLCLILVFGSSSFAQNDNTDQVLEEAKEVSQQFVEDHNIDQEKQVYITRAVYSYKKNLAQLNDQNELSEAELNDQLTDIKNSLRDNIRHALNDDQLTQEFIQEFEFE